MTRVLLSLLLLGAGPAMAQGKMAFLKPNAVVVFQGDSITDGGRRRTGSDFNHIMGQDYAYLLAAELGLNYPERKLTFVNRGMSGERVKDLAVRWQADTLALKPDVLSILVGINDTLSKGERAESAEEYEAGYDKLLGDTLAALPGVRIVLGEPFLLPVGKHQEPYAEELAEVKKRQVVVARLGAKYHLPVIAYQKAFDEACAKAPAETWSWDGVHPTYAGHALMAREWLKVAGKAWK